MRGLLVVAATLCGCSTVIGADFGTYRVAAQADAAGPGGALGSGGQAYFKPPGAGGVTELGAGGVRVTREDAGAPAGGSGSGGTRETGGTGSGGTVVGNGGTVWIYGDATGAGGVPTDGGTSTDAGSHPFVCPSKCTCSGASGDLSCLQVGFVGLHYVYCPSLNPRADLPDGGSACLGTGAGWCCP